MSSTGSRYICAQTIYDFAIHDLRFGPQIAHRVQEQAQQLDQIIRDIEEKKKQADHYAVLAKTNKEAFDAFKAEMEDTLRSELIAQAEKGKRVRQVVSFVIWLITLVLGAALGAYFNPILNYVRGVSAAG
jgi:hypothetical protein